VITHRIELGSFEREKVVEGFKTAATLNAAATSLPASLARRPQEPWLSGLLLVLLPLSFSRT
jgi:hypothetical protein